MKQNAAMHILLDEYHVAKDYTIVENVKILLKEKYGIEHCFVALENINTITINHIKRMLNNYIIKHSLL